MHVFHGEFGWGELVLHDIEGGKCKAVFNHQDEEVIHDVELNELINPYEFFKELAKEYGQNPEDFVLLPTVVYRDRTNDWGYEGFEELVFVPKTIAYDVSYVKVNFTMDSIAFYDSKHQLLLNTLSLGYYGLGPIEAFIQ